MDMRVGIGNECCCFIVEQSTTLMKAQTRTPLTSIHQSVFKRILGNR